MSKDRINFRGIAKGCVLGADTSVHFLFIELIWTIRVIINIIIYN